MPSAYGPILALVLQLDHAGINAFLFHQLLRRSLFRHSSVFQNDDLIRSCYCPHAMCYHHHGFIPDQPGERGLNQRLILHIQGGRRFVKAITCIEMELGEPDASGRRRPIEKKGSEFTMDVDTVIMSLGTSPNPLIRSTTPGLETNKHGCIVTEGDEGKTSRKGVYAGGDAVTGAATVIKAMGAGKAAAKAIDEYIQNK